MAARAMAVTAGSVGWPRVRWSQAMSGFSAPTGRWVRVADRRLRSSEIPPGRCCERSEVSVPRASGPAPGSGEGKILAVCSAQAPTAPGSPPGADHQVNGGQRQFLCPARGSVTADKPAAAPGRRATPPAPARPPATPAPPRPGPATRFPGLGGRPERRAEVSSANRRPDHEEATSACSSSPHDCLGRRRRCKGLRRHGTHARGTPSLSAGGAVAGAGWCRAGVVGGGCRPRTRPR